MSLNQRRREVDCLQTSLLPNHKLNILSKKLPCWECVSEEVLDSETKTDEQLVDNKAKLSQYGMLYDHLPSVCLSLDVTGLILSINQFGANSLGYTPEQLVKQPFLQLFAQSEQPRLIDEFKNLLTNKSKDVFECVDVRLNCPHSSIKWVKILWRLISDDYQDPVILMVCEDVTNYIGHGELGIGNWEELSSPVPNLVDDDQQRLAEEVLITEKRDIQEEFISAVSHELRTPLTNMKMAIQMLGIALCKENQLLGDTENSKVACYFEILNNECDREINLINNFLDLKRLETNSQPWLLETIHIEEWLRQVVEKFKQQHFRLCQQNLSLTIASPLPPLRCNSLSLERIVIELLTNACKFSPPDAAITISVGLKGNKIFLQVINFGVEIPSNELPRIFDKFYRIPSNDPTKQGGVGLGLTLAQKLTKQLGGTITVESQSNRTCFTLVVNSH
ncbi:PAS domain-containing sensor histidine kinase [Nostoc sp. CENA543]|uniref:PAS domain-containing sensor histidine kinase n=1 Tax=Nostoc sp. CENA543 TaxID=1869241 RepID=UPI001CEF6250|nr:PAS domain-containing sensor histidine kinase [Nostoc sp. CENA543]